MPEPLTGYISTLWSSFNTLDVNILNWSNTFIALANDFNSHGWTTAYSICLDLSNLCTTWRQQITQSSHIKGDLYNALHWIDLNWDGDGAVDMDAILNAMLVSSFDQLQKFIGIVDAYRVALWNAPFNADFYAALARGFQQWPQG